MKKFNSFRNRQNGFEDLGSGTAEAAKTKKSWWKVPGIILVILVIAIFTFQFHLPDPRTGAGGSDHLRTGQSGNGSRTSF